MEKYEPEPGKQIQASRQHLAHRRMYRTAVNQRGHSPIFHTIGAPVTCTQRQTTELPGNSLNIEPGLPLARSLADNQCDHRFDWRTSVGLEPRQASALERVCEPPTDATDFTRRNNLGARIVASHDPGPGTIAESFRGRSVAVANAALRGTSGPVRCRQWGAANHG